MNSKTLWIALAAVILVALGWFYMTPETRAPSTTPGTTEPAKQ